MLNVPCALMFQREDPRESLVPRHCVRHPQKPQWRLVRQRREGLPLHL